MNKAELDIFNAERANRQRQRNRGWKYCFECKELKPRGCRNCEKCREHCTCEEFDKWVPEDHDE